EEIEKRALPAGLELSEDVPRDLGFLAVSQDDLGQVDAPSVVPESCLRANAPERPGQELLLQGGVPIALVEVRPQIMALEVREDVPDQKRSALRPLHRRMAAAVRDPVERRGRVYEVPVKIPPSLVVGGLDAGHAAVVIDSQIRDVAGRATDLGER